MANISFNGGTAYSVSYHIGFFDENEEQIESFSLSSVDLPINTGNLDPVREADFILSVMDSAMGTVRDEYLNELPAGTTAVITRSFTGDSASVVV